MDQHLHTQFTMSLNDVQAIVEEFKQAVGAFDKQLAKSDKSGKAGSTRNGKSIEQLQQDIEGICKRAQDEFEFQSLTLEECGCSQP